MTAKAKKPTPQYWALQRRFGNIWQATSWENNEAKARTMFASATQRNPDVNFRLVMSDNRNLISHLLRPRATRATNPIR
jgi:hypothetical protein